jgi:formylglycine-generating enzyme required for sulfatase activity
MAGNIWELAGEHEEGGQVVRGGSFLDDRGYARCACRYGHDPSSNWDNVGFRVAVSCAPGQTGKV